MRPCFECDAPAGVAHHVVPRTLGGTRTVPLCLACHARVHEVGVSLPALQRAGIERARHKYGGLKEDPSRAMALRRMGYTVAEIAESLGVSADTVRRYLRRGE